MVIDVNRKRLIVTSLISIILVCILFIGNTLSIETIREVDENLNYYNTGNLDISYYVKDGEVVLNNSYPMSYEEAMGMDPYRITVTNNGNVDYEFSLILEDVTETNGIDYQYINVQVGVNEPVSMDSVVNNVIMDGIVVKAGSSVDVDIFVWVSDKIPNTEIGKGFYAKVNIDGFAVSSNGVDTNNLVYNLDSSGANRPVIEGDMIPVYYDYDEDVWKKADVNNRDKSYQWYDYDDKMWANVVLVKDNGIYDKSYYLSDDAVGHEIKMEDIVAFFTWIPRYKYKAWDINRNSDIDISSIEIMFESGVSNTGNVLCEYNGNNEDELVLSDSCYYNGELVDSSGSYVDAWYTHPAFNYDGEEITGFWVGKFETTGSSENPTILPDNVSLRNQSVGEQFEVSRLFNNYGLGEMDAHMEMSLEYGALVYLTYSIYGVCDSLVCGDIYNNNSSSYYTGSGSLESDSVSDYGTYNYQGFLIDNSSNSRNIISDSRSDVIASSTLNVYGVYDLRGGAVERVMGVSNGIEGIDSKYYNLYSKGNNTGGINRSMLGDAIIISGSGNYFIDNNNYVLVRGNLYNSNGNMFSYSNSDGNKSDYYGFRVVLS